MHAVFLKNVTYKYVFTSLLSTMKLAPFIVCIHMKHDFRRHIWNLDLPQCVYEIIFFHVTI